MSTYQTIPDTEDQLNVFERCSGNSSQLLVKEMAVQYLGVLFVVQISPLTIYKYSPKIQLKGNTAYSAHI